MDKKIEVNRFIFLILAGLISLSISLMFYSILYLKSRIISAESKVSSNESTLSYLKDKAISIESLLLTTRQRLAVTNLSIYNNKRLSTDKINIDRLYLSIDDNKTLNGVFDISPQPSYILYFKGQGKFDLSDREVRKMIQESIDKLKKTLDNLDLKSIGINIDDISLVITQNNYDVATYSDNNIVLAGEKQQ